MIDIHGEGQGVSRSLSNFTHHRFMFDGVHCSSMEGFLQSLKYKDPNEQSRVCGLSGWDAKRAGGEQDNVWKHEQTLWWQGESYDRHGDKYQKLLDRVYRALAHQNTDFREALLSTGNEILTHKVGKSNPYDTCLTENELCTRLMCIRSELQ